jgi:single-stranded DNA-binding protein
MPNTNTIILEGHIGKAPDLSKKPYRISIATTIGYNEKKRTLWHDVTVWSDTALQGADKGDIAHVIGYNDYSTKDEKKYTNIIANSISIEKKKPKTDNDFVEE